MQGGYGNAIIRGKMVLKTQSSHQDSNPETVDYKVMTLNIYTTEKPNLSVAVCESWTINMNVA